MIAFLSRTLPLLLAVLLLGSGGARAAEVTVMSSGGFYSALEELGPVFEKQSGHKVVLVSGSSMGSSPTSIPARLQRGEPADLVVLVGTELDRLIAEKLALAGSKVDLAQSRIGMAVRAGAPRPDIRTREAFERTLLEARSIGYSGSASGKHLVNEVFPKLGSDEYRRLVDKSKLAVNEPVAAMVARGDVEIGFQQVSEMLTAPGVDFVGAIPDAYQKVTVFSAGLAPQAKHLEAAKALIRFLTSPAAYPLIEKQGLEPASRATETAPKK